MSHLQWYPGHEHLLTDIVRAENCHLYDSRGRRYVDLESGVWCASVGHGNPRVVRLIGDQASQIAHNGFVYSTPLVEEAAQDILSLLGFGERGRCVFLCSGSEAVEYGVRVARSLSDRPLFMTMADSYFGAYGSASIKNENEWFCFDWFGCAGRPASCAPGGGSGAPLSGGCNEEGCSERCEHWARIPFEKIGGFLLEPGSSSGLVRFPPPGLIRSIARRIKDEGGLFLVNEVTTGIGRTGRWFGFQHYGIEPDIVAVGKGIGNGYPISAACFGPAAVERLGDRPVRYAQSHQNDPLGAAVAREVVRIIREEGLIEKSGEIAALLAAGLDGIKARTGRIREIRARGLMVAIELEDDPETSLTIRTHRELVRRGFIVGRRPGVSVLRLDPSLTIDRKDIEEFLATFEDVLLYGGGGPHR